MHDNYNIVFLLERDIAEKFFRTLSSHGKRPDPASRAALHRTRVKSAVMTPTRKQRQERETQVLYQQMSRCVAELTTLALVTLYDCVMHISVFVLYTAGASCNCVDTAYMTLCILVSKWMHRSMVDVNLSHVCNFVDVFLYREAMDGASKKPDKQTSPSHRPQSRRTGSGKERTSPAKGGMFATNQRQQPSHFTVHPDWASEAVTGHSRN